VATESCGDHIKNGFKEQCDDTDLGNLGCVDLGFSSGTLRCTSICRFNTTTCS
jgi:hypothetical protein